MDFELIKEYAYDTGIALVIIGVILSILYLIDFLTKQLKSRILKLKFKNVKLFGLEIINIGKQELIITTIINSLQIFVSLIFLYFSLVLILSEIPATEEMAVQLMNLIFEPLQTLFNSFLGYLPKLFNIIITIVIARYSISSVQYVASGVISGNFRFPGFHPRTARTTSGIIIFIIYTMTIILILPSMPGYESLAFKGIATFIGILITIGGSSIISNYLAGIVLTYMHAFEKGDWVEIDGVSGQIVSASAFGIRLDAFKEEVINIPNAKVLSSAIRNHSIKNKEHLILPTEISIGYDVPWKKVSALLIEASKRTMLIDANKEPFVLRKKLDDFYVVYELNAFLNEPEKKPEAVSSLHSNILDVFNDADVEIMSPHYRAERDGRATTVTKNKEDLTNEKD